MRFNNAYLILKLLCESVLLITENNKVMIYDVIAPN